MKQKCTHTHTQNMNELLFTSTRDSMHTIQSRRYDKIHTKAHQYSSELLNFDKYMKTLNWIHSGISRNEIATDG